MVGGVLETIAECTTGDVAISVSTVILSLARSVNIKLTFGVYVYGKTHFGVLFSSGSPNMMAPLHSGFPRGVSPMVFLFPIRMDNLNEIPTVASVGTSLGIPGGKTVLLANLARLVDVRDRIIHIPYMLAIIAFLLASRKLVNKLPH